MAQVKKKVLFTSHTANFSKFNRPFMRWFAEQGYEVHYASMGEEQVLDCDKHFTVPFTRSPFKLSNIAAYRQLKKIIDAEGYDIIHTHTPMGSVVTRLAAKVARKNGTRVIYTAHGFHFFTGAPLLNWLIYYPVEKYMARHTDTLITINKEDYERAKRKFSTDVRYVPGVGIDPKKFDFKMSKAEKLKLRKSLGLKEDDFVMIYPAELNKNKNQTMLINAMEQLVKDHPNIHVLLPGLDSMNGYHKKLAEKKGLSSNIHFLGYRNDIPKLLKISDLSVSTSQREGLAVNVMEAMCAGLPTIVTNSRGNSDLISEGVGFVVNVNDTQEFIKKVSFLIKRPNVMYDLGKCAQETVKAQYSQENVLDLMGKNYKLSKRDEPIRVLQVVTIMNRAGLETMLMNYYRQIDRSKVQFDFLVHRFEKGHYDDEILSLGGKIYRVAPISIRNIGKYKKDVGRIFNDHPEYKIVHSHIDALSALPLYVAQKHSIPVRIGHSHNTSFDKDAKLLIRNIAKRFIPHFATDLAGCSQEALSYMFGSKGASGKVVRNAVDTNRFNFSASKRDSMRTQLGIDNKFVIGNIARFSYQKNHGFLIDVFNEVLKIEKNAVLLLVGNGENEPEIRDQVEELGLEKSVIFLGQRDDIADIMQAMDVFTMPSRFEGLPVVSIEAQASGLPCVFSDTITKDLDITGNCTFINLDASKDVWVKALLRHKDFNRRDTSKEVVNASYDIANEAEKLSQYYSMRSP